jgi:hypothetical protein
VEEGRSGDRKERTRSKIERDLSWLLIFSGFGAPQRIWHYLSPGRPSLALASDEQGSALFRKPLKDLPLGTPENRGFSN